MSTKFVHSIKVPRLYKESAKSVKKVLFDGASFKSVVFKPNHPNVQGIYALVSETLQHCKELESIIDETKILIENPRLDPWLARILITELLWGKMDLKTEAKPIITVLNYKEKLKKALVQNSDAVVDPCDRKKVKIPRYVRVNTLLMSIDEALDAFYNDGWILLPPCDSYYNYLETLSNLSDSNFIQDFHIPELFVFPPGTKFHDHPGYLKGKLLLQDKASCLSAFLLDPKPNSEILDMCAAPGMKTTHLAAIINNSGKVYAVEMNENRYQILCEFVTHTNAECIETIRADAVKISPEQYPNVKYILVDPSCSGSGIVDRIEVRKENDENLYYRLKKLQSVQSMILSHALLDFPNVKRVIYSTCSIHPEENECVIDEVSRRAYDTFALVDLKKKLKNEWQNFGSENYSFGNKCLYALPQTDLCNGFFVAMFKRKSKVLDSAAINLEDFPDELSTTKLENEEETVFVKNSSKKTKKRKMSSNDCQVIVPGEREEINENLLEKVTQEKTKHKESKVENVTEESNANDEVSPKKAKKEKKKKRKDKRKEAPEEQ